MKFLASLALGLLAGVDAREKVFGLGLSRTGTSSLGDALTAMGYENIHNDRGMIPFLNSEMDYNFSRYDKVDAVEDLPSALYYEQLLAAYPTAKFVLSVREEDGWYRSSKNYMAKLKEFYGGHLPFRVEALLKRAYGTVEPNEATWKKHFREHNARVQEVMPASSLLVINVADKGQGYPELCSFLKNTDGPCEKPGAFPQVNELAKITDLAARTGAMEICNVAQKRGNAYATFMADVSDPKKRNYFLSVLVLAKSLQASNSTAEFVVQHSGPIDQKDKQVLESLGVRVLRVGPVGRDLTHLPKNVEPGMAAIYRNKVRVLRLTEYNRVMFLDADMIAVKNMDSLFSQWGNEHFVGMQGFAAPLNSGWFILTPSCKDYVDVNDVASSDTWTPEKGWMEHGSFMHPVSGLPSDWNFHSSSSEQGLFWYYYFVHQHKNILVSIDDVKDNFVHFLGKNKPWNVKPWNINQLPSKFREAATQWWAVLDTIRTEVSTTLHFDIGEPKLPTRTIAVTGKEVPVHFTQINDPYPTPTPRPPTPPKPSPTPKPAPTPKPPTPVGDKTCGGNCPGNNCDKCVCGTKKAPQNAEHWCQQGNSSGWNMTSCKCIMAHESGGNGNAINENSPTSFDVGLFQINTMNWATCNGGNPPCSGADGDNTANVKCAMSLFAQAANTWARWATCTACGVCGQP